MSSKIVKCSLIDNAYEISYFGNLKRAEENTVFFEDTLILINKKNLEKYLAYINKNDEESFSFRLPKKFFEASIIEAENKSKTKEYIYNRFSKFELSAFFFKKNLYPAEFKIKDYQIEGIKWLQKEPGRLLADDMGLGKTAQALVGATRLIRNNKIKKVLIVCPSSLMQNWMSEIKIWAQSFKGYKILSAANSDNLLKGIINHGHFFIVNYDQLRKVSPVLMENPPDLIICDEAHKLRKKTSQIHKGLKKLSKVSNRFWALTGTPIEKNTDDLISIMQVITPNIFNSETRKLSPLAIKGIVKKNFLRRLKSSVLDDLSDLSEQTIYLTLPEKQRIEYERIKKNMILESGNDILKCFNQLRAVCDEYDGASIKYEQALSIIEKIKFRNEKVVIFSYTVAPLKSLKEKIDEEYTSLASAVFEGSMDLALRSKTIKEFKNSDTMFVLLCSGKIAGEGLNLTEANNVIFLNEWWNPSSNNQARDRVHRIGQSRNVTIINLRTKNTVEESLDFILKEKKNITTEVIEGMIKKG